MPTYTLAPLVTNAAQDRAVQRAFNKTNSERVARGQSPLADIPSWALFVLTGAVQDYQQQYMGELRNGLGTLADAGTVQQITNAYAAFGATPPA